MRHGTPGRQSATALLLTAPERRRIQAVPRSSTMVGWRAAAAGRPRMAHRRHTGSRSRATWRTGGSCMPLRFVFATVLALLGVEQAAAQTRIITGRVTDSLNGEIV